MLQWNFNLGNILTTNILLNLAGSWELSVQPWYFTIAVDKRGTDNDFIRVESGKKYTGSYAFKLRMLS